MESKENINEKRQGICNTKNKVRREPEGKKKSMRTKKKHEDKEKSRENSEKKVIAGRFR